MFYFDDYLGNKVLRSDYLKNINAFFTTRGVNIYPRNGIRVISPIQTHSDHIEVVDKRNGYPDTDGLIVTKQNIMIYLRFADCTPLIFYDPINKIGAVSHAGWRGTAAKIGVKTIKKMGEIFGSKAKDIVALIGPAISVCCYEVSDDVREKLISTVNNIDGLILGKNVDLKQINARQLQEAGVEKIDICPYCTSCNNDLFYSYRKENSTKERHFAALML
jgi:YfiH family protein